METFNVQPPEHNKPVLVAGATGYIGGRLLPRLLEAGHRVRAVVRTPAKLGARPWSHHPALEVVRGDLLDRESIMAAARGCRVAYYLVHSMQRQVPDFADVDRRAALNMVDAAAAGGVERIIYLSGLGDEDQGLSRHLRSRTEVARILGEGPVPVTVFRAAMIIGSGSASFEILRYLVDRLPVMITPRWVSTPCQPIGVRNVLYYLVRCLDVSETTGKTFDIGQEEVLTYRRLMEVYAEEAGLPRRLIIPVPFLTPRLSSYWIHLVTPVPAALARPLAEGLSNPVVCRDFRIRDLIPSSYSTAGRPSAWPWTACGSNRWKLPGPIRVWCRLQSGASPATRGGRAAPFTTTRGGWFWRHPRRRSGRPWPASAAAPAGIMPTGSGGCGVLSTDWRGEWG
jgi:uncharacterized protein YbjT (DUF2867 family)